MSVSHPRLTVSRVLSFLDVSLEHNLNSSTLTSTLLSVMFTGQYLVLIFIHTHTHYTLFSYTSFCHLRPQIAKARRGGRRGNYLRLAYWQIKHKPKNPDILVFQSSAHMFLWFTPVNCRIPHTAILRLIIKLRPQRKSLAILCSLLHLFPDFKVFLCGWNSMIKIHKVI